MQIAFTLLDISTAHISERTANLLMAGDGRPEVDGPLLDYSLTPWMEYGWIIHVSPDWMTHPADTWSTFRKAFGTDHDELGQLLLWAARQGARYLKLDCDGYVVPELPRFQW